MDENTIMTYKETPDNPEKKTEYPKFTAELPYNREADLSRLMQQVHQKRNQPKVYRPITKQRVHMVNLRPESWTIIINT